VGRGQQRRARLHPTNSSWLNRIEAQFTALRYFALDGTDQRTHQEQASMIRPKGRGWSGGQGMADDSLSQPRYPCARRDTFPELGDTAADVRGPGFHLIEVGAVA
jgi:hypothetical protein